MTDLAWARCLLIFGQNQKIIVNMEPSVPAPAAKFCRESAHRALGHLTACQAAWLPLMRQLGDGASRGAIPINPDPLYGNLGDNSVEWRILVERFTSDRAEWRQILDQIDLEKAIRMPKRTYSVRTLTGRMVEHEKSHLEELF